MSDYDYGRENGLWGVDGIPYGIDREPSYRSQARTESSFSIAVASYVQLMKEQGIKTVVNMNKYLTRNNLWNKFSAIQRMNTYSSGYKAVGVSREAYAAIMDLYQTDDVIFTRLKESKKVA